MPNKAQFVEALAERLEIDKKRAAATLDAVIEIVYESIARGEKVALTGFGVFEKRLRGARIARNPATGATVRVKKTQVPAFRAGAEFKAITSGAKKLAKAPARKAASVSKAAAKKTAPAKRAAAKATSTAKATARKAAAKKAPAKTAAKKAPAKKSTARRTTR